MQRSRGWRRVAQLCLVWGAALVACAGHVASLAAQEKPPDRFTLPVQLRPQETELWCWAATGQMTMEFLGKNVTQSEQANRALQRADCGQRPVPRPCIRGGVMLLTPYGFTYEVSRQAVSEPEIVRQIYSLRRPIPFAWTWPGGGGHAALVVGYSRAIDGTFFVECLDPFPPPGKNPRAWAGGQRLFIPHRRWAGDFDHAFDHALINVTKQP